jgi:hypothetical protein
MVISFRNIGSLLAVNYISYCGVVPCNVIDYTSVVWEYTTWAVCNSEMYFDLFAFPLCVMVRHFNSQEVFYTRKRVLKYCKHGGWFFENMNEHKML